jgi:hypothetical protein
MGFLGKIFKGTSEQNVRVEPEPSVCPKLEYIMDSYWCDIGKQRIQIGMLIYSYNDIHSDHLEKFCKKQYKGCPVYRALNSLSGLNKKW